MTPMLEVSIEDRLSGPEYLALMHLLMDLQEQEPEEIEVLPRFSDGSGYRMGVCDACGQEGIVYEWHRAKVGDVPALSLCPSCNGGRTVEQRNGRYFLMPRAN